VRYLLLCLSGLSAIPAWCGSITVPFNPTISCIVTTVPPNPIVANGCSSTPGITSNIGSSGVGIVVNWGPNNFNLAVSSGFSILLRESPADLNLAVRGSIMGHVEYSQDFILTGGPGLALVGGFQGCDSSDAGAPVFTNLSVGGIAPGVFHLFASADLNWTLTCLQTRATSLSVTDVGFPWSSAPRRGTRSQASMSSPSPHRFLPQNRERGY
jgi:hypothetical protein